MAFKRPCNIFGILSEKELFLSKDDHFNKVKTFHGVMDGETQEKPVVWQPQDALYRTILLSKKELVKFVRAASTSEEEFDRSVAALHEALGRLQIRFVASISRDLHGRDD